MSPTAWDFAPSEAFMASSSTSDSKLLNALRDGQLIIEIDFGIGT
jgi:hypothetical protein